MVKLTAKYLLRNISKKNQFQVRKKGESDQAFLSRTTHLHLQSQYIDKIGNISECQSVSVIYLQNNSLQTIHKMCNFPSLTHLYLQHNYIGKIENLETLKNLKKLYLGYNNISVVEGLEGLKNLTELHLENQRLPQGETLYFDPRTLRGLSNNLRVLNIAHNNVTSVECLSELISLTSLNLEGNNLTNECDLTEMLWCLQKLETLTTEGNPIANDRKHLDAVVVASESLKILNGKEIDSRTRVFITNMSKNLENRRRMSRCSPMGLDSEEDLPGPRGDVVAGPTPRLGSRLFPVLKKWRDSNPKMKKIPSTGSSGLSPVFQDSLKVLHASDMGVYFV